MEPLDKITLYRFRVRTSDGREAVSRVVATRRRIVARLADAAEVEAPEPTDKMLANPRWSRESFGDGDRATMQIDAAGLDGRPVKFVVERREGEEWIAHDTLTAKVADGVAAVSLDLPHPSPEDPAAAPAEFRFSCELA